MYMYEFCLFSRILIQEKNRINLQNIMSKICIDIRNRIDFIKYVQKLFIANVIIKIILIINICISSIEAMKIKCGVSTVKDIDS